VKNRLLAAVLLYGVGLGTGLAPCLARTWTDVTGRYQFDADFVDSNNGKVWLKQEGTPTVNLKLGELSKADREFVDQEMRRRHDTIGVRTTTQPGDVQYGPGRELCKLAGQAIDESSGIACSRRVPGLFWTHNDAGDAARIYLFDLKGRDLGSCLLAGIRAFDWEDMASFKLDGRCYLALAETGNNGRAASVQMLHIVEEPPADPQRGVSVREVPVVQTINFTFEDDHRDCEALGIDPTSRTFLLISKEHRETSAVYSLPWPENNPKKAFIARRIATLKVLQATAMDVSPDGRRAVVLTYGNAYEYTRGLKEDWAAAFSRSPREIVVPNRVQGESICYGPDAKSLYLTSEQSPTPLIEVPGK
jgi:hypothetical protein